MRWGGDYKWIQGTILAIVHVGGTRFIHCEDWLTRLVVDNAKQQITSTVQRGSAGYKGSHSDFSVAVDHS